MTRASRLAPTKVITDHCRLGRIFTLLVYFYKVQFHETKYKRAVACRLGEEKCHSLIGQTCSESLVQRDGRICNSLNPEERFWQ